ncbi:MAG: response regulator [Bryobacterales bacterium]|nr:response regulator [Bryobacterales bacterium]
MRRTILIVEDSDAWTAALQIALEAIPGIQVVVATSAAEALRLLDTREFAALVTDLNMPRMDGFELIQNLRAGSRHERLPIVVISGDTDIETPRRLTQLGVSAYFPKPFSPAIVRARLEQLLDAKTNIDHRP